MKSFSIVSRLTLTMLLFKLKFSLESADLFLDLRQIVLNYLPDDFKVQAKVVVNNSVSQSGYPSRLFVYEYA